MSYTRIYEVYRCERILQIGSRGRQLEQLFQHSFTLHISFSTSGTEGHWRETGTLNRLLYSSCPQ